MAATLAPGVGLVPEALASPASAVASAAMPVDSGASVAPTGLQVGEFRGDQRSVPAFTLGDMGTVEMLTGAAIAHDAVVAQRSLEWVPPSFVEQTLAVSPAMTAVSATMLTAPNRDWSRVLVPGLRPPAPGVEWGGDQALPQNSGADADQLGVVAPLASRGRTPFDHGTEVPASALLQLWESDAWSGNDFWDANPASLDVSVPGAESSHGAPGSLGAAALAIALAGVWGTNKVETEPRTRRRLQR
jgi:hypothetical protein